MIRVLLALVVLMLAGCATTPPTETRIPIPVECREAIPARPVMPTEGMPAAGLLSGGGLDEFVQAAMAEIERREGYEVKLLDALKSCTSPLSKTPP